MNMQATVEMESNTDSIKSFHQEGKYLTFTLGAEEYGLEILKVREIIGIMNITAVPRTPDYVRGVINLRGKVIPVVSLRVRFGMEDAEDTDQTCIIVVDVERNGRAIQMGILVDSVSEVLDITGNEIEAAPAFGNLDTGFILGMAKFPDGVKILLHIDKVLEKDDIAEISKALESVKSE